MPEGISMLLAAVQDVWVALVVPALLLVASVLGLWLAARDRARRAATELEEQRLDTLARAYNPFTSGEPIRDPEMFFGREELLRRILNVLHQNSIMIHGERRMGKTTVLFQLADRLARADDPEWAFVPVYVDLEGTPERRFFQHLMEAVWGALTGYVAGDTGEFRFPHLSAGAYYSDRDFMADLRGLLGRLKAAVAPRKARLILLVDEMDVVNGYPTLVQQQLRRVFMSAAAANLGAVVAGTYINKAWERVESPWYNLFHEMPLEPFSDEDARKLLAEPVRGIYEWDPDALEFAVRQARGRPYRLQRLALVAVEQMLEAGRLRIKLDDVREARDALERSSSPEPAEVSIA